MNKGILVSAILMALATGFVAGRYSITSDIQPKTAIRSVNNEKTSEATSAKTLQSVTENGSPKTTKPITAPPKNQTKKKARKKYTNIRQVGEAFTVGLLEGQLDEHVNYWVTGEGKKLYQFGLTLKNNTEGRLLTPGVSLLNSKDNFGNECPDKVIQGPDKTGWETKGNEIELRPGDSMKFKFQLESAISSAKEFKSTIAFNGTGIQATWDPRLRFKFDTGIATETTKAKLFAADSNLPSLESGSEIEIGNTAFKIGSIQLTRPILKPFSMLGKRESQSEDMYLAIQLSVFNNDERKELSCKAKFSMHDDVGNTVLHERFSYERKPADLFERQTLKPGKSFSKIVYFKNPLPKTQFVEIEFGAGAVGNEQKIKYIINSKCWETEQPEEQDNSAED